MNKYNDMKQKHEIEINDFPMMFAFSDKQFKQGMEKLGLQPTDLDKIYSINGGGFYKRSDSQKLAEIIERHTNDMEQAILSDKTGDGFIFDMFDSELSNHEYCITMSIDSTLDALGLTMDDIENNKYLEIGLRKARKEQWNE